MNDPAEISFSDGDNDHPSKGKDHPFESKGRPSSQSTGNQVNKNGSLEKEPLIIFHIFQTWYFLDINLKNPGV